jgi:predicted NBD/HSP70 family sugar kinase
MRPTAIGQRSETVRRSNLSAIVGELHADGPLSRSDLVARTGLTRSAIRALIGELAAAGLVSEGRAALLGTPGRPSPMVRPSPEGAEVLALDVAVDSVAVAVVGLGGEVIAQKRVDRPRGHTTPDATVADLVELTSQVTGGTAGHEDLVGIGVAVAALVRRPDGFVSTAPNLGWRDVPFGDLLAAGLGTLAPISIGNEADLGALAELRRGAAIGRDDVLFISGEVGVGGGLIVGGLPLTGAAGYGGEVGHMPVSPAGRTCGCGAVGCWETEVGEGSLLVRAGHPADGGRDAVDAVLRDAAAGSPEALDALRENGRWLGIGLAGLVNVLNPELVVLGGLFGRIHPFVRTSIDEELDRRALAAPRRLVEVIPAKLGVDAPLLGAAELAFEALLANPADWMRPRRPAVELASA